MKVVVENIITNEKVTVKTLEEVLKKLSIRREDLQSYQHIVPFENGVFAKYAYMWYRITAYETIEGLMQDLKLHEPLPIAMTRDWTGIWKPFTI